VSSIKVTWKLRIGSMTRALYCPDCGSDKLLPFGAPSPLDGKRGRQCANCGVLLAPPRSRFVLGLIFTFGLAVTGFCVFLKWRLMAEFRQPFAAQGHLFLGILLGPVVMIVSGREIFRRMPRTKPSPWVSVPEDTASG
jgi:hypothetical protein